MNNQEKEKGEKLAMPVSTIINPEIPGKAQSLQVPATDPVPTPAKADKKTAENSKEGKTPRTYEEICADLSDTEAKNANKIDRYVSLLLELVALKGLTPDQVQFFFASVNELIEDAWSPFLVQVSTHISPNKLGNNQVVAHELIKCCSEILESCGLAIEDMEQACHSFRESKDGACITDYLKRAETVTPAKSPDETLEIHKITPQELACVSFICFNYSFRKYAPSSFGPLVKIDRAIAEHFSQLSPKDYAGKILGNVLGKKAFNPQKITELVYLYDGTTDEILRQSERISALEEEALFLRAKKDALAEEIERWKGDHADLVARIEALEAENERYCKERDDAENMLEFETNRFERQLRSKRADLAKRLNRAIELELQAIRETTEYIDENNQRRIRIRLQQIDDILHEFGGGLDA